MTKLTHLDESGKARMVDVGEKQATHRRAVARGTVQFNEAAFTELKANRLAKGDALAVARIAGIQASKRTAEWIPLCHTVPLDRIDVEIELVDAERTAVVTATATTHWKTGVEMEALVAVSAAGLALYDMAKAIDRGIVVRDVQLLEKDGGRSGAWKRQEA
jgi:cyclic pyranopterin phosphate synthase